MIRWPIIMISLPINLISYSINLISWSIPMIKLLRILNPNLPPKGHLLFEHHIRPLPLLMHLNLLFRNRLKLPFLILSRLILIINIFMLSDGWCFTQLYMSYLLRDGLVLFLLQEGFWLRVWDVVRRVVRVYTDWEVVFTQG